MAGLIPEDDIREAVRERYAAAARQGSSCCGPAETVFGDALYADADTEGAPATAVAASLGCGVPTAVADLHEGETVLDLGSGAGADVLISAQRVGPAGKAYGLDMTDEMLELARRNAAEAGAANVEFLKGYIEQIPLPDASVDVVISNCVINLAGDKSKVFAEAGRVLRPGGRFAVSDVVADPGMDDATRADMAAYTGCIAGALTRQEFEQGLAAAGFTDIEIRETHRVHDQAASAIIRAVRAPGRMTQAVQGEAAVLGRLSTLDRFLPVWIGLAMAAGLALGALVPGLDDALDDLRVGTVSLPIALGLLLMMYPVLAKVRYEELGHLRTERRLLGASLLLNWVLGPLLMFALAWLFLSDHPAYRTGLIIVGLARCIAMVLIWSELACADNQATALLVAINSLFQIVAYSLLGWLYLTGLPDLLGLDTQGFDVSLWEVARTVLIFLGIPLLAGYLTRREGVRRRGQQWYEQTFLPRIGPIALYGLLFTIVMLFAIQGDAITNRPLDVALIALPLLVYFLVMFWASFALGHGLGLDYPKTATLAFTAASNNFELAIAVAVGVFGATSGQALAGVVGPLIEVPVLVGLVYVALWAGRRLFGADAVRRNPIAAVRPPESVEPA